MFTHRVLPLFTSAPLSKKQMACVTLTIQNHFQSTTLRMGASLLVVPDPGEGRGSASAAEQRVCLTRVSYFSRTDNACMGANRACSNGVWIRGWAGFGLFFEEIGCRARKRCPPQVVANLFGLV